VYMDAEGKTEFACQCEPKQWSFHDGPPEGSFALDGYRPAIDVFGIPTKLAHVIVFVAPVVIKERDDFF
jgi:hypothetical protein